jgi:hypothetical protein
MHSHERRFTVSMCQVDGGHSWEKSIAGENLQHAAQGSGDARRYFGSVGLPLKGSNGQMRDSDFVRANLAKQLEVSYDTAEKVLNA